MLGTSISGNLHLELVPRMIRLEELADFFEFIDDIPSENKN